MKSIIYQDDKIITLENSTSTVWDTALLSYSLQKAGVPYKDSLIMNAASYLLLRQHTKMADWSIHNSASSPGGWGFSNINTNHPDNDDTAAVLRAITQPSARDSLYFEAWNKGSSWLLTMQNRDGGFGAFEKNVNNPIFASIPLENAKDAVIQRGIKRLMQPFDEKSSVYPTGIGLPKQFYIHYHSYNKIFPLLALSHYRNL